MRRAIVVGVLFTVVLAATFSAASAERQKLYILSSAGNDVTVVDVATNKIIGSIEVGDRPHGLAAPASQDILYVEEISSIAVPDGSTVSMVRIWVRKGTTGLKLVPFYVQDTTASMKDFFQR